MDQSTDIDLIKREYKSRNNIVELNDFDTKLIESIQKLRIGYSSELNNRKCSKFLSTAPLTSIFEQKKKTKGNIKQIKDEIQIVRCTANILKDGSQCKFNAKIGEILCGRHLGLTEKKKENNV